MNRNHCYAAIDIGAGRGAKIGFFDTSQQMISERLLGIKEYSLDFDDFSEQMAKEIRENTPPHAKVLSIGISSAGILSSDGGFQLFANCARYNGHNIKKAMEETFDIPVAIETMPIQGPWQNGAS